MGLQHFLQQLRLIQSIEPVSYTHLRVLRVLSKQGVDVQELNMKVQSDGMELEIVLNTESDVAQMAKLLAKQVAVVSVNTLMLQEQAAV